MSMMPVDLRSDTVTRPTPAMREAMAAAAVGDDVFGEDPTVNLLQEKAARVTGHEAGLFVPSGTMGNLVAVLAHCRRGDEAIVGNRAHTFLYEAGGISALGGVHSHQLPNRADGTLDLDDIRAAIRGDDDPHCAPTRLIALENTHNRRGGMPLAVDYTEAVAACARAHGLRLHLDGARLFNAAVALGVPARALAASADSVTFCLSKGLCAPVGSVLCGSAAFIQRAHRVRKQLGGGMRQAGVVAAAGIVALDTMVDRLAEDHARARALADGLGAIPGVVIDPAPPPTNMVFVELPAAADGVVRALAERGVLLFAVGPRQLRLVVHYWIDDAAIERAVDACRRVLGAAR